MTLDQRKDEFRDGVARDLSASQILWGGLTVALVGIAALSVWSAAYILPATFIALALAVLQLVWDGRRSTSFRTQAANAGSVESLDVIAREYADRPPFWPLQLAEIIRGQRGQSGDDG